MRLLVILTNAFLVSAICYAQELIPRAYYVVPVNSNAITLSYSFTYGGVLVDPSVPIKNVTARLNVPVLSYYHSFNFFGRMANFTAVLPYAVGHIKGEAFEEEAQVYRSGLADTGYRFSVNLKGGPAMSLKEYQSWHEKTILGTSFTIVAPTGQYDPVKLVNIGTHRWAFKSELGYSHRWEHWILDGYGGVWFYTTNSEFFPGTRTRSQKPIGVTEAHLSYDFKTGWWASFDANYWYGGTVRINGLESSASTQSNSRIGGTLSMKISKRQTLRFSFAKGAITRVGGDYNIFSCAWGYSWIGKHFLN